VAKVLTRAEAADMLAATAAERDKIQANLLDLDASFGRRLLDGASLAGSSRVRWEAASADLALAWETFAAYSAVVKRATQMLDGMRRPPGMRLAGITALLTGPSVVLPRERVPLGRRRLTDDGHREEKITLAAAVQRMTIAFRRVVILTAAAESVWTEVSDRLDQIASVLGGAVQESAGIGDDALTGTLDAAGAELRRLRDLLSHDPLSLWQDDRAQTAALDRLLQQAQAAAARAAELGRLQEDADRRIAGVAQAVAVAQACEQDARAARDEATLKIAAGPLAAPPPGTAGLSDRLAGLEPLKAAGRWARLAAHLDAINKEAAAAAGRWQDADRAARALVDRRTELRGLLDAYRAKAAGLGGAENTDLAAGYQRARDLLWSAPCDLAVAADAVRTYQQAVLALQGRAS
jgi:hypothetical protein